MLSWLFDSRASLENPSVSLTDPEAWEALFGEGSKSASGMRVTKKKALMAAPVWAAVSLISGAVAKLPLNVYRRRPDLGEEGRSKDEYHPAAWLVRWKANPEMTAFFFWRTMMVHLLLYGNAYAFIDQDGPGLARELWPMLPDRTAPERLKKKQLIDGGVRPSLAREMDGQLVYVTESNGQCLTFLPSQVLHLRGMSLDGLAGCDLIEHAKNEIGLSLSHTKYGSLFFRNGARKGGVLKIPAAVKKETKDKIEEGFRQTYENEDAWFKTFVARDNVEFHEAAFNPQESQLVEADELQTRKVARFFKLQPSKLGVTDSASYNSKTEDNQAFLDDTLSDHLVGIGSECWIKLLSKAQQERDTHFFEHNTAALLKMDLSKRYAAYRIACGRPWMTVNQVRAAENEPPIEGGDVLAAASPGAAAAAPQPAKPADDGQGKENDPSPASEGDGERTQQERRKQLYSLTAQIRHKASRGGRAMAQWIADYHRKYAGELEPIAGLADLLWAIDAEAAAGDDDLPRRIAPLVSAFEEQMG